MQRTERTHPLALAAGLAVAIVFLVFALPPIVRFVAFLLSGDVWRGLLAAALICFLVGLVIATLIGFFERRSAADPRDKALPPRSRGRAWWLVWILVLVAPVACIVVALVASGALIDIIGWVGDRVTEIRGAQS